MNPNRLSKGRSRQPSPLPVHLIFILLSLFSAVGLDYISARKGGKSLLFTRPVPEEAATASEQSLDQILLRSLSAQGFGPPAVEVSKDEKAGLQLKVSLSLNDYSRLEPILKKELKQRKASLRKKEQEADKEKVIYLWQVKGRKRESLSILFTCVKEEIVAAEEKAERAPENQLAVIIDDMGLSLDIIREICSWKKPITISILPLSPLARETAAMAHENGLEVMLHLSCESLNNQEAEDPTDGFIRSGMTEEEVRAAVERGLEQVPHVAGVNNHMGSKITQDETIMRVILRVLEEKNLFFLDSRTSENSIAYDLAQQMGIPSAQRNIFLDSVNNQASIKQRMTELVNISQKRGVAVGIGHPFAETLDVLKANLDQLETKGIKLVFASKVVHK